MLKTEVEIWGKKLLYKNNSNIIIFRFPNETILNFTVKIFKT